MIFGIKESIFWPIHCIVGYCYTYTHATYDWFCAPLLRTEQSNIIVWNAGVHQVALLTHVDQVCNATRSDITKVYKSQAIQQAVCHAGLQCLHLKASLCHVLLWFVPSSLTSLDGEGRRAAGNGHILHRPSDELLLRAGSGSKHRYSAAQSCWAYLTICESVLSRQQQLKQRFSTLAFQIHWKEFCSGLDQTCLSVTF